MRLVRRCYEHGLHTFDLGIGEAHYKNLFCGNAEPLFVSFLPPAAKGQLLAAAPRLSPTVKRAIKQQPALWETVQQTRRQKARFYSGC